MGKVFDILFKGPKTPEERKRNLKIVTIVFSPFILLAIVLVVQAYFAGGFSIHCGDMNCFIARANQCKPVMYNEVNDLGTINYYARQHAGNCSLKKEIRELSENEDPFLKKALEGKEMECAYSAGDFNSQWTMSLIEGLEYCDGELKDAIGKLLLLV
jgi:hypothetical protein